LLRGNGPLGPISRRHLGRRLTRHPQPGSSPASGDRTADCASSVGSDARSESSQRDSRHEGREGSARVLACASFGTTVRDACPASPSNDLAIARIDRTRAFFRCASSRWKHAFRRLPRWPSARCCRWESLHHEKFRRPLTSPVACRHPRTAPSVGSSSYAPLSRSRPTTPPVLRPTTRSARSLATPPNAPDPPPFDAVSEEDLHGQSRTGATPVRGWRSLDSERLPPYRPSRACARESKRPEFGDEHEGASHTVSPLDLAPDHVSVVCQGAPRLACRIHTSSCDATCPTRDDAYDRLLPSTASISSTRVSLAPDAIESHRTPSGFTPPAWLEWRIVGVPTFLDLLPCLSRLLRCAGLRISPQRPTHREGV